MKFITAAFLLLLAVGAGAQNAPQNAPSNSGIVHTVTSGHHISPQLGRELWFTMIKNYDDQGGKYYNLYVASPSNTDVTVEMNGAAPRTIPVHAGTVATFNIPLAWEMDKSSIVENKAIHVWSDDADISAYLMSHNPYTSDGMFVIPTIGWGRKYVVAAYNALYEGSGTYIYDYPSEMAIVANQDSTVCTITPSCDIRKESTPHGCKTCVEHAKGTPFTEVLNRGQAIQYLSLTAENSEDFDLTGTVVTSNKPVGVVGGSMCPNIPMDFPYCDHVCEMIPPVRTWSSTYYSAPFYPANPGKEWSTYLVVGSKDDQVIKRYDAQGGEKQYCVLAKQFDHLFRPDIDQASRWTSDAPFMLVQYINSSTYPDGVNSSGDPAEVVVNGVGQFTKKVLFQTPTSVGNQTAYKNYVNLIVSVPAEHSTKFDGNGISSYHKIPIDTKYSVYRVDGVKAGTHTVTSDSAVGVYVYGYGFDESYAWAGALGTGTFDSPDLDAPDFGVTDNNLSSRIALNDGGTDPSELNYIRLDAADNMTYTRDANWLEGAGENSSFYDEKVVDDTKQGLLQVSVFDAAGNMTQIVSKYDPQRATITAPYQDFGVGNITAGIAIYKYDTLTNVGSVTYPITDLRMSLGDSTTGFSIDSAVVTPLSVGEKRVIKIAYLPKKAERTFDTIIFGDGFLNQQAVVTGTTAAAGVDYPSSTHETASLIVSGDARSARAILPGTWTNSVSLDIKDVRGVTVLTSLAHVSASLDFDLSTLTSGVYFYRLTSGNENASGKLVIRK